MLGGTAAISSFKDQIGALNRKDFIPYSERLAMEAALADSRKAELAAQADAPDDGDLGSDESGGGSNLLSFLPGNGKY